MGICKFGERVFLALKRRQEKKSKKSRIVFHAKARSYFHFRDENRKQEAESSRKVLFIAKRNCESEALENDSQQFINTTFHSTISLVVERFLIYFPNIYFA